jgi:hypothetical protein
MKDFRIPSLGITAILCLFSFRTPAATLYVSTNSPSPTPPYTDWSTAAWTIQPAINAAANGDTVLVNDGIYDTGGVVVSGTLSNRVALTNAVTVRSVNGPQVTRIQGSGPIGDSAVRCAYVGSDCVLVGFTLTNGATLATGNVDTQQGGGGVFCEGGGVVSNCWIFGNSANKLGGGADVSGTLNNCLLAGNTANHSGGGAFGGDLNNGVLNNCTLSGNNAPEGGGARGAWLNNCLISNNSAGAHGGGAYLCTLTDCTLSGNSGLFSGGGAYVSRLKSCTLSGNTAAYSGVSGGGGARGCILDDCTLSGNTAYHSGGGAFDCTLTNCTLSGNTANYDGGGTAGGTLDNCTLSGNVTLGPGGGAYASTLKDCTLSDNTAANGGGATYSTLNNCRLSGNFASNNGGGANGSTLKNCVLSNNNAIRGGGVYGGSLNNCTLVGNSASRQGGGVNQGTLTNCVVYYNSSLDGPNYVGSTMAYCCTTPYPGGVGNTTKAPRLVSASHIAADSPCVGAGIAAYASGVDVDGEPWRNLPAIGADEPYATTTGALSVAIATPYTQVVVGFQTPLTALIDGPAVGSAWDFGDGSETTNLAYASHAWITNGTYAVVLRAWNADNPAGVACTVTVSVVEQTVYYVDAGNSTPAYPYANWVTAATNIQDAISTGTAAGRLILVTNGVYQVGGVIVYGELTNRVALTNAVMVRSVNGPQVTIIRGNGPIGDNAVRCAYVGSDCVLVGFTLTNGATRAQGNLDKEQSGGGVWCETSGVLSNCVLAGNLCRDSGGGAYGGTLDNCVLSINTATNGGGSYGGTLNSCTLTNNYSQGDGGGAYGGALNICTLSGNRADHHGGGSYGGTLNNCTLTDNRANFGNGGGVNQGTLYNCILSDNRGIGGGGGAGATLNNCTLSGNTATTGGGATASTLNNCIIFGNAGGNYSASTLNYCCTTPSPGGQGNVTNPPLFVSASDFHILDGSPSIDAGTNQPWMVDAYDLDGNPRIIHGAVDIGVYESGGSGFRTVTLQSEPSGVQLSLNGNSHTAPHEYLVVSTQHVVSAPLIGYESASGTRYGFGSWTDGGQRMHSLTVTQDLVLTANYVPTQQLLRVSGTPVLAGTIEPGLPAWHDHGASFSAIATAGTGWRLSSWTGETNGCLAAGRIISGTMDRPRVLVAHFETSSDIAPIPRPDHVVIVIESERSYNQIINEPTAPFINSLAQQGALLTQFHTATYTPSEANYLALFSGSTHGVTVKHTCPISLPGPNLASKLIASNLTFVGFAEGMPSVGYRGCTLNNYAIHHIPWLFFTNVPNGVSQPLTYFPTNDFNLLPHVSLVIPNLLNDMNDGTTQQGDAWLQQRFGAYAAWAKTHNSLLIVTWDQDDGRSTNHIPTILAGALVKPGTYAGVFNSYSLLSTLEDMFGLPHTGNTTNTPAIAGIWQLPTQVVLTVVSPNGGTGPGVVTVASGTTVSVAVTNSPLLNGHTQAVCVGAVVVGNNWTQVTPTNVTLTLTNDATLYWQWQTNYWLDTSSAGYGTVLPASAWLTAGSTATVMATANPYYHFSNWTGSLSATQNPYSFVMDQPNSLIASYAENQTSNGTPEAWLAQYGWTNDFEIAATNDDDIDGAFNWEEWIAGTDPTNRLSVLRFTGANTMSTQGVFVVRWPSTSNRFYDLSRSSNLSAGTSSFVILPGASNLPATPFENSYTDSVSGAGSGFYRIDVRQ